MTPPSTSASSVNNKTSPAHSAAITKPTKTQPSQPRIRQADQLSLTAGKDPIILNNTNSTRYQGGFLFSVADIKKHHQEMTIKFGENVRLAQKYLQQEALRQEEKEAQKQVEDLSLGPSKSTTKVSARETILVPKQLNFDFL